MVKKKGPEFRFMPDHDDPDALKKSTYFTSLDDLQAHVQKAIAEKRAVKFPKVSDMDKKMSVNAEPKVHTSSSEVDSWFNIKSYEVYKAFFEDPELEHVSCIATAMFVIAAIIIVVCSPLTVANCPFICDQMLPTGKKYKKFRAVMIWLTDVIMKTGLLLASLHCVWLPLNRFLVFLLGVDGHLNLYIYHPESQPVEGDNNRLENSSLLVASVFLGVALLYLWRYLQQHWHQAKIEAKKSSSSISNERVAPNSKAAGDTTSHKSGKAKTFSKKRR